MELNYLNEGGKKEQQPWLLKVILALNYPYWPFTLFKYTKWSFFSLFALTCGEKVEAEDIITVIIIIVQHTC